MGLVRFPGSDGPFATRDVYPSGDLAKEFLALPRPEPPDAVYLVQPLRGFEPVGPTPVAAKEDLAGKLMKGTGNEYRFGAAGSGGPGTVVGPVPIPESLSGFMYFEFFG
jgi:hypothetical protein